MKNLGQKNSYKKTSNKIELDKISRNNQRQNLLLNWRTIHGFDIWNCYEVSFLINSEVHNFIGQLNVPSNSENIFESKSLKLFLNSMNNKNYLSKNDAIEFLEETLSKCCNIKVDVKLFEIEDFHIDNPIGCDLKRTKLQNTMHLETTSKLITYNEIVKEALYTDLFRSNCLVTNQPDWGTVTIDYIGNKIDHDSLHSYLLGFRNHNAFHEHCIDMIFDFIMAHASPSSLTVYGNFLRRGGIDITPIRTNTNNILNFWREIRQ